VISTMTRIRPSSMPARPVFPAPGW
jgi:hypothetical protein